VNDSGDSRNDFVVLRRSPSDPGGARLADALVAQAAWERAQGLRNTAVHVLAVASLPGLVLLASGASSSEGGMRAFALAAWAAAVTATGLAGAHEWKCRARTKASWMHRLDPEQARPPE
jgi:hypothetical protein